MYLMVDNYDSFVYNLACYMEECGEQVELVRNDKITAKNRRIAESGNAGGSYYFRGLKAQRTVETAMKLWKNWHRKFLFWGYVWDIRLSVMYLVRKFTREKDPCMGRLQRFLQTGRGFLKGFRSYRGYQVSFSGSG